MQSAGKTPSYRSENAVYYASACGPMREAALEGRIEHRAVTHGHYFGRTLPDDVLPGVCTVGYWNARADQDWRLDWHRNEGLELNFQASGQNGFSVDGGEYALKAGDLAIAQPWRLHRFGAPRVGRGVRVWALIDVGVVAPNSVWTWPDWIALTRADKERLATVVSNSRNPVVSLSAARAKHWKNLYRELQKNDDERNLSRVALLVNEILFSLLELASDRDAFQPSDSSFNARIIEDFLRDFDARPQMLRRPWTPKQMAELCGMSVANFYVCFRELTNASPNQFLNAARVERATKILQEDPRYPIARLAADVGFSTGQYFATIFKKATGATPSEYAASLESLDDSETKKRSANADAFAR